MYVFLKQRKPAYRKYQYDTGCIRLFQTGTILHSSNPNWKEAATLVDAGFEDRMPPPAVDALLKMSLYATQMLTSPNYSGNCACGLLGVGSVVSRENCACGWNSYLLIIKCIMYTFIFTYLYISPSFNSDKILSSTSFLQATKLPIAFTISCSLKLSKCSLVRAISMPDISPSAALKPYFSLSK